jgi:transcriptional regulator GlxA family with amidase domain
VKLGIPVYDGVDLLDVTGPLEMFYWVNDDSHQLETVLISEDGKSVTSVSGVTFQAQKSFADVPALDILWVPGGSPPALEWLMKDEHSPYLEYLRKVAANAKWVCSVCEGALLLGRAGLLKGHTVTTHWAFVDCLKRFEGVTPATGNPRFVISGNRLTGGGISSGLDEALKLIALLFDDDTAKGSQVTTQYFPQPPVMGEIPSTPACFVRW